MEEEPQESFSIYSLDLVPSEIKLPFNGKCDTVDRYEKIQRIGEGTYGIVYKSRDTVKDNFVALKRVRMEDEANGIPLSSLREISILKSLDHDNIVKVVNVAVGVGLDSIFLVMEYCEYDLAYIMDHSTRAWSQKDCKCLLRQLLNGLDYCHDRYIIHRDLKLSNLLLNSQGILKIADFGLARLYSEMKLDLTPKVVTLWYRAPELILGESDYTKGVDLWSVGCIMGEWMRHSPLFPGESEQQQLDNFIDLLGTPNPKIWPEILKLPYARLMKFKDQDMNMLKAQFQESSQVTIDLLNRFLTYNPSKRITPKEALRHAYFNERPFSSKPSEIEIPEFDR